MQVNTRATHAAQVERMSGLRRQLNGLQGQIATGKRIAAPSDDPVASGIATRLRRVQAEAATERRGIAAATSRLAAADAALGGVGNVLQRAKELALQGATVTLNASDRATLTLEATALGEELLGLANATAADGTPLFGGAKGKAPAFARDAAGIVQWTGIGGGGLDGLGAFTGPASDAFALLDRLGTVLAEPATTRAASLATVLTGLDVAVSRAADARAAIGTRQARLETAVEASLATDLRLETDLAGLEGLDMAAAIARLQHLATVLEATQASFVKLGSLSLWDRL